MGSMTSPVAVEDVVDNEDGTYSATIFLQAGRRESGDTLARHGGSVLVRVEATSAEALVSSPIARIPIEVEIGILDRFARFEGPSEVFDGLVGSDCSFYVHVQPSSGGTMLESRTRDGSLRWSLADRLAGWGYVPEIYLLAEGPAGSVLVLAHANTDSTPTVLRVGYDGALISAHPITGLTGVEEPVRLQHLASRDAVLVWTNERLRAISLAGGSVSVGYLRYPLGVVELADGSLLAQYHGRLAAYSSTGTETWSIDESGLDPFGSLWPGGQLSTSWARLRTLEDGSFMSLRAVTTLRDGTVDMTLRSVRGRVGETPLAEDIGRAVDSQYNVGALDPSTGLFWRLPQRTTRHLLDETGGVFYGPRAYGARGVLWDKMALGGDGGLQSVPALTAPGCDPPGGLWVFDVDVDGRSVRASHLRRHRTVEPRAVPRLVEGPRQDAHAPATFTLELAPHFQEEARSVSWRLDSGESGVGPSFTFTTDGSALVEMEYVRLDEPDVSLRSDPLFEALVRVSPRTEWEASELFGRWVTASGNVRIVFHPDFTGYYDWYGYVVTFQWVLTNGKNLWFAYDFNGCEWTCDAVSQVQALVPGRELVLRATDVEWRGNWLGERQVYGPDAMTGPELRPGCASDYSCVPPP